MAIAVRRYRVEGEVQGVGFRWFVRERARALGLSGVVRNEPDGAVVLHVAGDSAALDALESTVRVGPSGSRVVEVLRRELTSFDAEGLPFPFTIER
ncbi:MAG: acylphosphatase [Gemmatimonadota bacterium]|nr:acylphosphatase [Gemmatimonadota bacterium]